MKESVARNLQLTFPVGRRTVNSAQPLGAAAIDSSVWPYIQCLWQNTVSGPAVGMVVATKKKIRPQQHIQCGGAFKEFLDSRRAGAERVLHHIAESVPRNKVDAGLDLRVQRKRPICQARV